MRRVHASALLLLATGACGGHGPKVTLRYRPPAGAVYRYGLEQRTELRMESGPLAALGKQHILIRMYFTQTVKGPASRRYRSRRGFRVHDYGDARRPAGHPERAGEAAGHACHHRLRRSRPSDPERVCRVTWGVSRSRETDAVRRQRDDVRLPRSAGRPG